MQLAPLVSFVLAAAPVAAQASWSLLPPPVATPSGYGGALGVHENLGKAILLWGSFGQWVLTGNTWSPYPGAVPPVHNNTAIAFDAARNELLVFGGQDSGSLLLNDTWRWNGTQWAQAQSATAPGGRFHAAMAFDRARGVMVLFGGRTNGTVPTSIFGDTWEWNGVAWQQRFPATSPQPRHSSTMAFDPVGGGVLLYGGVLPGASPSVPTLFADTWRWNGTTWSQLQPMTPPPGRIGPRMTTDLRRQRIVLFGGDGGDSFTWEWDGSGWHVAAYQPTPGQRYYFGMGYDDVSRRVIVHGGLLTISSTLYFLTDTWTYRTPLPADAVAFGAGCAGSAGVPQLANAPYSLPWIGDTVRSVVSELAVGSPGAFFVASLVPSFLPMSLAPIGAPGCDLLLPPDLIGFAQANGSRAEWPLAIPATVALAGISVFQQAFPVDPAVNPLGLVASNGLRLVLGIR